MKYIVFILILFGLSLGGCRKYEEGPLLSIRTVKKRIEGVYELEEFKVNGVDRTQDLINTPGYCPSLSFQKYDGRNQRFLVSDCDTTVAPSLTWADKYWFTKHKSGLLLTGLNPYMNSSFECFNTIDGEFDIVRLTMENLWLEITINNEQYIIKYINTN